jgi:hypothetical protein
MAISNYTDLQNAIADYLNRADLTSVIPTFISFAEAKFNRELRTRDMLMRAAATSSNEFIAVPTDFLEDYSLELDMTNIGPQQSLNYIGPLEAKVLKANKATGKVRYYTIIDGAFELIPAPQSDTDVILTYYQKIPSLSVTQATNWLLTKSPDLYTYAALLEAAPYLKDDQRLQVWAAARGQVLEAMKDESERSMRSTTQLVARKRSF